jgi:hypothetical protein
MRARQCLAILLTGFLATLSPLHAASADVSPGDVVDKSNWEKAEGLLPDPVLNWIKQGDFIIEIGQLNYNPADYIPPFAKEALKTNLGKYELDANDGVMDVKTGKPPERVIGLPFPQIDPNDPKLAAKLMQNNHYMQYLPGNLRFPFQGIYIDRSGGFDRESENMWLQMAMDGYPGATEQGLLENHVHLQHGMREP